MNNREYISISEYAEVKGLTKQAVYKQLDKKLKPFLIIVEGKKHLKIEVLSETEREKLKFFEQQVVKNSNNFEQQLNNDFQRIFEEQLAKKDEVIETLLRQVESLTEQNRTLTEQGKAISDLLKSTQILLLAERKDFYIEDGEIKQKEKRGIFGIFRKK